MLKGRTQFLLIGICVRFFANVVVKQNNNKETKRLNLINEGITHNVFGEGSVIEQEDSIITIAFEDDTKKFVYPDAFEHFITLNDPSTAKSLEKMITKKELQEAALEEKREEERRQQELDRQRKEQLKNLSIHESSQIVFWLEEDEQQTVFTDWQVFTGTIQSGNNKGQPNRVVRLRPNSASLLTVRTSEQTETERKILGLFMVNEMYAGNLSDDGIVPAHDMYRIELTEQEAEKMHFWNYYINENHPHRTTWNSGRYRYFDNIWIAQILKDILALKTDEEEIKEVEAFLAYFCQMNVLDIEQIPEANGALKQ